MRPRLAGSFSKSSNIEERDRLTSTTRQQSKLVSLLWGQKGDKGIWENGSGGHVE